MKRPHERGQTIVLISTMLGTMMLFAGLSVDLGSAYVTKARLSRAADAASMVAMRNLSQGKGVATQAAKDAFAANYKAPAGQAQPTVNVTYKTDSDGNTRVGVSATSKIKTAFVGVVPAFKQLNVGASAEAVRSKLIMSLVLDRSGSMVGNGGWSSLAPAVTDFIDRFDESMDKVAMVTFATTVRTDVTMRKTFKSPIKTKVPDTMSEFEGWTNSVGGLEAGYDEIHDEDDDDDGGGGNKNVTKVVVFFTDGLANTFRYSRSCSGGFNKFALAKVSSSTYGLYPIDDDGDAYCTDNDSTPSCCTQLTTFKSVTGSNKTTSANNIGAEARLAALHAAKDMRDDDITVFSVGLGGDKVDADFLREIPNEPGSAGYDKNAPSGTAFFPQNASDLSVVFQTVAAKILLRLSK